MFRLLGRLAVSAARPRLPLAGLNRRMHYISNYNLSQPSILPITLLKPVIPIENETSREEMFTDSVMRKRRLKMKKHKLRKRRKRQKAETRKQSRGK
ncbi:LADA_0E14246g1_1 [Lachancea dasiensis]|uniref:LADA_0E14246g1_1 n=1 Tax=Lachancea dasiensis TaxID=1072105 RepID=A0A1G4JFV8_9SACH|nr:LADA_0E14246g1_1 [Lachancea dasiensis]